MRSYFLISVGLLVVFMTGCSRRSSTPIISSSDFREQVVQDIYNGMPYSQAEVYLTALGQLSDEEIWQYGDRVCESLRRGSSIKLINEQIQSQFTTHEELFVYNRIMSVAENQLCPDSSFPPAGLPRSLFFMWERLNGGTPL